MKCAGCRRDFSSAEPMIIEITKYRDADGTTETVIGPIIASRHYHPACLPP